MHGETLADVLSAHLVPTLAFAQRDLTQSVTNQYAVSAGESTFLLAYYVTDGSGIRSSSLNIVRYDRQTKLVRRAVLEAVQSSLNEQASTLKQVTTECLGSVLNIEEYGNFIEVETHINPSAACTLLLRPNLAFVTELFGWVQARVGHSLILQENTIHFAPTHPLLLEVYDLRLGTLSSIYPAKQDIARERFSSQLAKHLPRQEWCAEENNACDPNKFSADINHLEIEKTGMSFAFDVTMQSEGFGNEANQVVHPETAHYICRYIRGRWILKN